MDELEWTPDLMLEVSLGESDDFLKVRETLTRIGIASKIEKTLYQSCHILHKQGRYYILHFKELFLLDGKNSDFTEEDRARRNTIANLLHEWELVDLVDEKKTADPFEIAPIAAMIQSLFLQWCLPNEELSLFENGQKSLSFAIR